ncbi:LysR family transcriptional regulator [Rheinheimera salexigens]|uniref:LysR family transcriptional regulator n=1 Tax=Rheinheimera salexigens TaxID=1628148 RepID=A0A1E7Q5S7_9GAMM|nr:LysR family transcriptional regulator [Rheinheimera salexigens]OEY69418.1 LysR family transcriptional regulator [Rheinheimera salexigens]
MDVRHLSFRLLQVYVRVVQVENISAAARQLHLTQPTVSLQLKKLSEIVGETLIVIQKQQFTLTSSGEALYRAACDVLSRFDDFNSELTELRGGRQGKLSVAIVNTAQYLMPRILGPFYQQFPNIDVTLHIANRAQILHRFEHQLDDIYLFSHPPSGEQVIAKPIVKNPLQVIAPLGHWAAGIKQIDFTALKQERFLLRELGSASRLMFESWLSSQGIELSHSMQIDSNEAIRLGVVSGLGLSVISAHTLVEGREKLAVLDVKGFPINSHWYLVRSSQRRLSHASSTLIQFIDQHLAEIVDAAWLLDSDLNAKDVKDPTSR